MIKFFQKLKAKKGFTLVELIVVIAIIGVLAAILIPTMLGYVTSSRVTSANSTAASIKNNIDTFLTNADTAGYGMKQGSTISQVFTFTITNTSNVGVWSISAPTSSNFKTGNPTISWGSSATTGSANQTKAGVTDAAKLLCIELGNLFPEIHSGSIYALLHAGKCVAVAYSADLNTAMTAGTHCPNILSDSSGFQPTFSWDNKTAGVNSDGLIVGTAPAVQIG